MGAPETHVYSILEAVDYVDALTEDTPHNRAEWHARHMFDALGIPCDEESTADTPGRFVRALAELTSGMTLDPARHLARTFPPPSPDPGMILVPGIPFVSICEHHLLPFTGTASISYIPSPGAKVLGLSKFARITQEYAARPQMQEKLGDQIVAAIADNLDILGAACVIRSVHSCMTLRGARATGAAMVTSHLAGVFREDPAVRAEFFQLLDSTGAPA
ncbi:GTP cyclohydrolase I [Microtetraspora fusca]|uniref:GTP cyclohydrolase 1 n=1 Tax=Microtetraspora fusca TaxID=1997 RepID=A0ABW6VH80_MICFU